MRLKLYKVYRCFFKLLICFNLFMSLFVAGLFFERGFGEYTPYLLMVMIKCIGFLISVVIEKWFYANKRSYFFKNLGLGYRTIFSYIFLLDLVFLCLILFVCWILRSFL